MSGILIDGGDDHQDGLDDDEDGDDDGVVKEPDDSQPAEPEAPSDPATGSADKPGLSEGRRGQCCVQWLLPPPPVLRPTAKHKLPRGGNGSDQQFEGRKHGREWK